LKNRNKIIVILCALFLVIGCSNLTTNVKEDPYKVAYYSYSQMLQWYTQSAETYNVHYQVADAETKVKWKADIDPIFKKIKMALDTWKVTLSDGGMGDDSFEQIKHLKSALLAYGLTFLEE